MRISLATRVHEYLADHIGWVQYPNIRPGFKPARRLFWKHQMPWTLRAGLALYGVVALCAGVLLIAAGGLVIWAILTA